MEWISNIGISAAGLPWWAVFALLGVFAVARELIPAINKWRGVSLEERKYDDGETKEGYKALIEELKQQVDDLKDTVTAMHDELRGVRSAHMKCEVDQATLRGELNVMKEKVARLEAHEERNQKHVEGLKEAVKIIDPEAATKVP